MSSYKSYQEKNLDSELLLSSKQKRQIEWILILFLILGYAITTMAQTGLNDLNYQAQSEFQPTIKDAVKFSDIPEIKDSVKRIDNIKYTITSTPIFANAAGFPEGTYIVRLIGNDVSFIGRVVVNRVK